MTDQQAASYRGILVTLAVLVAGWGALGLIDRPNVPFSGLHFGNGNVVSFVSEGSPAEHAGIVPGDRVLSIDGTAVHGRRDLDRMQRPQVGQTQTVAIDRGGEQISFEVTMAGLPLLPAFLAIIGISFLVAGVWAYLSVPTGSTLLLCCAGIGLGTTASPGPYLPIYALRLMASWVDVAFPMVGFACFLLFLLQFPTRKSVRDNKIVASAIPGLPILVAIADLGLALLGSEATAGLESLVRLLGGLLILAYLLLGLVAAAHSYFTASRSQRSEWGLNLMLAGLILGIVPMLVVDLALLVTGTENPAGAQLAFMLISLVPISMALAAVKKEKLRLREA